MQIPKMFSIDGKPLYEPKKGLNIIHVNRGGGSPDYNPVIYISSLILWFIRFFLLPLQTRSIITTMAINSTSHNSLILRAILKIAPNFYSRLRTLLLAIPIAAVALSAASALSACSKEVLGAPIEDMKFFYNEPRGLTKVSPDSIQRFATKVENYVTYYPETKSDPYYPEIVDNINDVAKLCGLTIHLTIDTEWKGEIEYNY